MTFIFSSCFQFFIFLHLDLFYLFCFGITGSVKSVEWCLSLDLENF